MSYQIVLDIFWVVVPDFQIDLFQPVRTLKIGLQIYPRPFNAYAILARWRRPLRLFSNREKLIHHFSPSAVLVPPSHGSKSEILDFSQVDKKYFFLNFTPKQSVRKTVQYSTYYSIFLIELRWFCLTFKILLKLPTSI